MANGQWKKELALSHSRIKKAACPYLFEALYVSRRHKEEESEALAVGGVFAELVAIYRKHCLSHKVRSDIEFAAKIPGMMSERGKPYADRISGMWDRFMSSSMAIMPEGASWYCVEGQYAFDKDLWHLLGGWTHANTRFRIVVDFAYRQGDTIYIIDDKTGQPTTADPQQLEIYTYFLPLAYYSSVKPMETQGLKRVVAIFNHVAAGYSETVAEMEISDKTICVPEMAPPIRSVIAAKITEVNSWTEFPPRECSECPWCSLEDCPLKIEARKAIMPAGYTFPKALESREQAEKLVFLLVQMDQLDKKAKDLLRKFVEANGPVVNAGKVAQFKPKAEWRPNSRNVDFIKALVAYGADLGKVLDEFEIGAPLLDKIVKHNPALKPRYQMLTAMGTLTQKSPSFALYKDNL